MDDTERNKMIVELEQELGFNIATRAALKQQIKQLKRIVPILGKDQTKKTIDVQKIDQRSKDLIYLYMGWL